MRILLILLTFIAAAGGAAWYYGYEVAEADALVQEARASFGAAEEMTLERAADYWLHAAEQRRPGSDPRGSGTALALAIRLGRAEAIRSGVEPVPDRLKREFDGDFPDAVLDEARWLVAPPDSRLGRVLARWPVEEGAVTLGDVIVFKTQAASRNRRLFAHELAHVEQYEELGISEFARRYAADPEPIEAEARAKAREVVP
jgi:hypothetical protein